MNAQASNHPATKAELLERIQRSWTTLGELLAALSPAQLVQPASTGWSIKDHMAHLAAWELWVAELLPRRPRLKTMQLEEAFALGKGETEINDLIYRQYAGKSLVEVQQACQQAHRQLLLALEPLSDADLLRPSTAFVPGREVNPSDPPVLQDIINNTYDHYDEHRCYIRTEHADLN